jgi:hypothetical protein
MDTGCDSLSALAAAVRGRSLLFVTSGGAAAETRFAVDPEIGRLLKGAGARVNETFYDILDEAVAQAHDLVILGAFPKTDAPELVAKVEAEVFPALLRAVQKGTGLLVMVDDHYSRIFDPLNRTLAPLGLEVLCEDIHEEDVQRNGCIPASPEIATLVVDEVAGEVPVSPDASGILLPNGWQSGVWPLLPSDPAWRPLLKGSPTSEARVLRHARPGRGGKEPVLAAARDYGHGRLAVWPVHSTFFFGNGMHPRWGRGLFLRSHGNPGFLASLAGWLASARPPQPLADRLTLHGIGVMPWFNPVPPDEQPILLEPLRGLVAVEPSLGGGERGVEALAAAAKDAGFAWAVFAMREEDLGDGGWSQLCEECARVSDRNFKALPAVDFFAAHDFGARGLAVQPEFWPPRGTNRRFVIQMIEEGGGWLIFSAPWASPVPPWNIGGFQGFEIAGFEGASQEPCGQAEDTFFRLQSHDWFLAPVARFRAREAGEIRAAANREATYVLAADAVDVAARIPKVGHCEFGEVFVSGGPCLREFWMEGPGMTRDVWEGRYYTWSQDPRETALLHIMVTSAQPLADVTLWESGRVLARFRPEGRDFSTVYTLPNTRDSRSYWLTATDRGGGRMVGMARRTKSGLFRAHGGGDRMNTYGSVVVPMPQGEFKLRGERCSTSSTMLFGLGWRQHQLNIYPPVPAVDYQPEGGEWGAPHGRLERIYLNPVLSTEGGSVGQRVLEDRAGFDFTSDEAALLDERITLEERVPSGPLTTAAELHLEKFSPPGSEVLEIAEFRATGRYVFGRWLPAGGPVVARFEREITFKQDVAAVEQNGIALRLVRMQADSAEFLRNALVGGDSTPPSVRTVDELAAGARVGSRAVAGIFPQPYGSFGFLQLEGPELAVRTVSENGVVALECGLPAPVGGVWLAGTTVHVVLLLVVSGLAGDGEKLFRDLQAWADSPDGGEFEMQQGLYQRGCYPAEIGAVDGAAVWKVRPASSGARVPRFTAVSGFCDEDSVWACDSGAKNFLPVSLHDGVAYLTVPESWPEVFVGTPVVVEAAGTRARLWPGVGGWTLALHNNSSEVVHARWRTNRHFPWGRECGGEETIAPGAEVRVSLPVIS